VAAVSGRSRFVDAVWRDRSRVQRGVAIVVAVIVVGSVVNAFSGDASEQAQLLEDAIESSEDGRFDDAVSSFTELIELEPDDTEVLALAYVLRSFALADLGRVEEVLADSTATIELEPADTDILAQAYVNRSVALARLGHR
jgi:tetratricopeptide (TPR) repeat protein